MMNKLLDGGRPIATNGSELYDVADFQQKAQYEAPKLN